MLKELEFLEAAGPPGTRPDVCALERVLPVIGGTVTEVLEQHLGEPLCATELVLERRVLLRGATTSAPVLYAESLIALDRLDPRVRDGLLTTAQPIGRLIREHRRKAEAGVGRLLLAILLLEIWLTEFMPRALAATSAGV